MSTRLVLHVSARAAIALASACASSTEPAPNDPKATLDQLPRALTAGEQRVIGAANEFSFALFRQLSVARPDSNVVASPLSASMALGMAMNGASGTTYDEMRSALGFGAGATETEIGEPAKLMQRDGTIRWLRTPDFEAVDLPYGNGAYSMTVLLPAEGRRADDVAASIGSSAWTGWMSQFRDTDVELRLPRFKLSWERELTSDLKSLGMRAAFIDGRADFSRMTTAGTQLYISLVKQKTFVDVNEEGTEAAAVTNVGISVTSLPVRRPFIVDRPFVFVLCERLSGTILFIGKITRLP